jgi:hypothetical protein
MLAHPPGASMPPILPSAEALQRHARRLFRLACHKRRTTRLAHWLSRRGLLQPPLHRLAHCRDWLVFRYYPAQDHFRLQQTASCYLPLLCPLCAIRRAAHAGATYRACAEHVLAGQPGLLLSYAVLTIHNGPDLAERFEHLQRHARQLLHYRRAHRGPFANAVAGAYSFEVKRGANSRLWHPHLNFLLLTPTTIDPATLADAWRRLTGDSYITYCRPRPTATATFVEIFKYALKFSDLRLADTYHAYQVLRRRKLLGRFGAFRGGHLPVERGVDEPYVERYYAYRDGIYRLLATRLH